MITFDCFDRDGELDRRRQYLDRALLTGAISTRLYVWLSWSLLVHGSGWRWN